LSLRKEIKETTSVSILFETKKTYNGDPFGLTLFGNLVVQQGNSTEDIVGEEIETVISENIIQFESEENKKLLRSNNFPEEIEAEIRIKDFNSTYHLILEFTQKMRIPEDYRILIDPRVLKVELESDYDAFNY